MSTDFPRTFREFSLFGYFTRGGTRSPLRLVEISPITKYRGLSSESIDIRDEDWIFRWREERGRDVVPAFDSTWLRTDIGHAREERSAKGHRRRHGVQLGLLTSSVVGGGSSSRNADNALSLLDALSCVFDEKRSFDLYSGEKISHEKVLLLTFDRLNNVVDYFRNKLSSIERHMSNRRLFDEQNEFSVRGLTINTRRLGDLSCEKFADRLRKGSSFDQVGFNLSCWVSRSRFLPN